MDLRFIVRHRISSSTLLIVLSISRLFDFYICSVFYALIINAKLPTTIELNILSLMFIRKIKE